MFLRRYVYQLIAGTKTSNIQSDATLSRTPALERACPSKSSLSVYAEVRAMSQ